LNTHAFWTMELKEKSNSAFTPVEIRLNELSDVEKYIEMAHREGFLEAMENPDTLLELTEKK
jgi:hypothetical protein